MYYIKCMTDTPPEFKPDKAHKPAVSIDKSVKKSKETGGRDGPDPTRYGDWEKNGRCIDF
ncbi:DUF1674 domain-containing protein [Alphaproteobacteria bacterium]|nr:DUF1674 domain-containing protein [Alphaproteobacteria bacterium]